MADDIVDDWWVIDTVGKGKKNKTSNKTEEITITPDLLTKNVKANKKTQQAKRLNTENEITPKTKRRKKNSEADDSVTDVVKLGQSQDLIEIMNLYAKLKMSVLEREDFSVEVSRIIPSETLNEGLPQYLLSALPKWKKIIQKDTEVNGSPFILVICSSGLRCMELRRSMQSHMKDGFKIAKLFAKHLKIAEQKKFLSKNKTPIGIGTPKRISDLIDLDVLNLDNLRCIVIDWNWKDSKKRTINDIKEIQIEMLALLFKHIVSLMKKNEKLKIGLL